MAEPRWIECSVCDGLGELDEHTECPECGGTGLIELESDGSIEAPADNPTGQGGTDGNG